MITVAMLGNMQIPPAAKVLVVAPVIYALIQGLKKIPSLTPYISGWVAIALNVTLAIVSLFIGPSAIPASQLYTAGTATAIINAVVIVFTTSAAAAGIHGTVSAMSPPQVLATLPPSTQAKEVPATLQPVNPAARPVEPSTK